MSWHNTGNAQDCTLTIGTATTRRFGTYNANSNNAAAQHKHPLTAVNNTVVQLSQLLLSLGTARAIFLVVSWQAQEVLKALQLLDLHLLSRNSPKVCQRSSLKLLVCLQDLSLVNIHLLLVINQVLAPMVSCTALF